MDRATLETAFRRLGGIPALARSEGGAAKIIDVVMAELAHERAADFHKAWGHAKDNPDEIAGGYDKAAFVHVQFWLDKIKS